MPEFIQRIVRVDLYREIFFDPVMLDVLSVQFQVDVEPGCGDSLEDLKRGWDTEGDKCNISIAEAMLKYEKDNLPDFDEIPWFLNASLSRALFCYAEEHTKAKRDGSLTAAEFWTSFLGDITEDNFVSTQELTRLYSDLVTVGFRPMGAGNDNSEDQTFLLADPGKYGTEIPQATSKPDNLPGTFQAATYYLPGGQMVTETTGCSPVTGDFSEGQMWFKSMLPPSALILAILNASDTGVLLTFSRASAVFEPDLVAAM